MSTEEPDLYKLLQVDPEAEQDVIEAAYKRLANRYHPDKNQDPRAHGMMQQLNHAYSVLGDADKRQDYDRKKRRAVARQPNSQSLAPAAFTEPIILPHSGSIKCAEFSNDSTRLVTLAGGDDFVTVWAVPTGQVAFRLQHQASWLGRLFKGSRPQKEHIDLVAVCPSAPFVITASRAALSAIVWDIRTGHGESLHHSSPITGICFSRDGELAAVSTNDRKIYVWRIASVTKIAEIQRAGDTHGAVAIDPARRHCAAQDGQVIRIWLLENGRERMQLPAAYDGRPSNYMASRWALSYRPDGRLMGIADGSAVIWDVPTGSHQAFSLLPSGAELSSQDDQTRFRE